MIKRFLALLGFTLLTATAFAENGEAEVRKAVEAWLGKEFKIESVKKTGILGLYEVQVGGDLFYTDEKGTYAILGNIVELKTRKDITERRKAELAQIKFTDLPLDLAIKQVKGNGKRLLATFEDPNCTYCKKLAKELQGISDVTIYTFLLPILAQDSADKSKAIWCASDRARAWNDFMINGTQPPAGKCDTSALDKVAALGRKLNVRGTPALFFADGSRVPGYMPAAQLEQALSRGGVANDK